MDGHLGIRHNKWMTFSFQTLYNVLWPIHLKNRIKPEFHPPTHEKEQKATFLNKINNKHRVISTYFDLQYTNTEEHNLYNKGHVVQSNDST